MPIKSSSLRLSAQRALFDRVTPNLRAVFIHAFEDTIHVYFFYDQTISEDERDMAEDAATEVIADFPNFYIDCQIERLDYPHKINCNGLPVYSRYEGY